MKAKLIKTENGYGLKDCELIAFVSTVRTEHRHHKLSLKNCQAIERGYDLDELARQEAEKIHIKSSHEDWDVWECLVREEAHSIKIGMVKMLELMGDKKFTEGNIDKAIEWGINSGRSGDVTHYAIDEFIKSLQQNEWECIILLDEETNKPLLNANGCLILKRS